MEPKISEWVFGSWFQDSVLMETGKDVTIKVK